MAGRKDKNTVDFFPHFCTSGKTIYILESKYGNDGYSVWFKTLEILGISDNHFIDCRDAATWEFMLAKMRVDDKRLRHIYSTLANLGAINAELWSKQVIWSENFINNVSDLYARRKTQCYTFEDLCQHLFNLCEHKSPSPDIIADIYTHSIVYDSIGNNSIVENSNITGIPIEIPEPVQEIPSPPVREAKRKPTDYTFIDGIIGEFKRAHLKAYGIAYEVINVGMERQAAGTLLKLYRASNPNGTSDDAIEAMRMTFKIIMDIRDDWLRNHMSLTTITSKYNDIKKIIQLKDNGNKRNKDGTTPATEQEIAAIVAEQFATDAIQ